MSSLVQGCAGQPHTGVQHILSSRVVAQPSDPLNRFLIARETRRQRRVHDPAFASLSFRFAAQGPSQCPRLVQPRTLATRSAVASCIPRSADVCKLTRSKVAVCCLGCVRGVWNLTRHGVFLASCWAARAGRTKLRRSRTAGGVWRHLFYVSVCHDGRISCSCLAGVDAPSEARRIAANHAPLSIA